MTSPNGTYLSTNAKPRFNQSTFGDSLKIRFSLRGRSAIKKAVLSVLIIIIINYDIRKQGVIPRLYLE